MELPEQLKRTERMARCRAAACKWMSKSRNKPCCNIHKARCIHAAIRVSQERYPQNFCCNVPPEPVSCS